MGKKAKLKQIRRIASQLPPVQIKCAVGEKVNGSVLIDKGVKELKDGTPVQVDKTYRQVILSERPLNHNRQMKKLYNKHGKAGVSGYIQAVQRHVSH